MSVVDLELPVSPRVVMFEKKKKKGYRIEVWTLINQIVIQGEVPILFLLHSAFLCRRRNQVYPNRQPGLDHNPL